MRHPSAFRQSASAEPWPSPAEPTLVARRLRSTVFENGLLSWREEFYIWSGNSWEPYSAATLRARIYQVLGDKSFCGNSGDLRPWAPTRRKVADVIEALAAVSHLSDDISPPHWLDGKHPPAGEFLAMRNGLLHLPSRSLHPLSSDYFTLQALPFPYDPIASRPEKWLSFLSELWPDDAASLRTFQEMCGYLISGRTDYQKAFLIVGPRRSGKGTILRVLTRLLGKKNVAAPTVSSLMTPFGLQPLIGTTAAFISDARIEGRNLNVFLDLLLSISGEDAITVDRKFKDHWTGQLPVRFLIASNSLPSVADTPGALTSRLVPLVLHKSFYGNEKYDLTDELLVELPRILNWSLEGLDSLEKRGSICSS